jgi:hypothetical protein
MQSGSQIVVGPNGSGTHAERSRLLKNGAEAHAFTAEDRAKGGRVRAEKMRRRKELRERFEVAHLDDLAAAELELLDQGDVRKLVSGRNARVMRLRRSQSRVPGRGRPSLSAVFRRSASRSRRRGVHLVSDGVHLWDV